LLEDTVKKSTFWVTQPMRILHLDGLRGIAIILVVLFHAYAGWPSQVPYGNTYADVTVFKLGWLGVELFFLVSGFVISITLEKTETFSLFIYKRWLRLFPAMLIATVLIYATLAIFHERPDGIPPNLLSALPGLTFMNWWPKLLNIDIPQLEVAFWTLYIEFKFYVIAGLTYYLFGKKYLTPVLVFLFALWVVTYGLTTQLEFHSLQLLANINDALSLKHFGWFAAGSTCYRYYQTGDRKWMITTLLLILFSALSVRVETEGFNLEVTLSALAISALFILSFKLTFLQNMLQSRLLIFFGTISYPLYLIHNNAMISMIIKIEASAPWLHSFLTPYPAIIVLVLAAYIIANYLEPWLSRFFRFQIESNIVKTKADMS